MSIQHISNDVLHSKENISIGVHEHTNKENVQSNFDPHKNIVDHHLEVVIPPKSSSEFKSFQYSMKQMESLHSYFSSENFDQFQTINNHSICPEEPQSLKVDLMQSQHSDQFQTQQINFLKACQEPCRKFSKHKNSQDLLQAQIITKLNKLTALANAQNRLEEQENKQQQIKQLKSEQPQHELQRKSYKSCLHEVVDKNHLQSPSKKTKQFQSFSSNDFQSPDAKRQLGKVSATRIQQQIKNKLNLVHLKKQGETIDKSEQLLKIKPIVQQNQQAQIIEGNSPKQISSKQKQIKKEKMKIQPRHIPSELFQSYDELNLSLSKNDKKSKQRENNAIDSPLKLKPKDKKINQQETQKQKVQKQKKDESLQNQKNKVNYDQQIFALLPIIQGYCQVKIQNSIPTQTKFVIAKNVIMLHAFKKLSIENVTKIKLIEKEEKQIFIKICYETPGNDKNEVIIMNIMSLSGEIYFLQSYKLFSQIVLRKLLLLNLFINQLNQKKQSFQSIKQPMNSPGTSSPMTLPSSFNKKYTQNKIQSTLVETFEPLYQAQLYKKPTFFNTWQKKYFILNILKGLQSFASQPQKNDKMKSISQLHRTSQIWTRFQLIYGHVVIKMWQNKIQKLQIGIPLCDFTNIEGKNNWLFGICKNVLWSNNFVKKQKNKTPAQSLAMKA